MNRLADTFQRTKAESRLALMPYLTAGFPEPGASADLMSAMLDSGADALEIGIPFSDPMADGMTMQRANEQALRQGATTLTALHTVQAVRARNASVPLVFMSYYNPLLAYGETDFCRAAKEAGADGIIVPDLPPEESQPMRQACAGAGIEYIFMLGPTSTPERVQLVGRLASGFIYCVALVGVTGARSDLSGGLSGFLSRVRAATDVPLVVGFGISRPEHVAALHGQAEGVIVASALSDLIESTPAEQRVQAVSKRIVEFRAAA